MSVDGQASLLPEGKKGNRMCEMTYHYLLKNRTRNSPRRGSHFCSTPRLCIERWSGRKQCGDKHGVPFESSSASSSSSDSDAEAYGSANEFGRPVLRARSSLSAVSKRKSSLHTTSQRLPRRRTRSSVQHDGKTRPRRSQGHHSAELVQGQQSRQAPTNASLKV